MSHEGMATVAVLPAVGAEMVPGDTPVMQSFAAHSEVVEVERGVDVIKMCPYLSSLAMKDPEAANLMVLYAQQPPQLRSQESIAPVVQGREGVPKPVELFVAKPTPVKHVVPKKRDSALTVAEISSKEAHRELVVAELAESTVPSSKMLESSITADTFQAASAIVTKPSASRQSNTKPVKKQMPAKLPTKKQAASGKPSLQKLKISAIKHQVPKPNSQRPPTKKAAGPKLVKQEHVPSRIRAKPQEVVSPTVLTEQTSRERVVRLARHPVLLQPQVPELWDANMVQMRGSDTYVLSEPEITSKEVTMIESEFKGMAALQELAIIVETQEIADESVETLASPTLERSLVTLADNISQESLSEVEGPLQQALEQVEQALLHASTEEIIVPPHFSEEMTQSLLNLLRVLGHERPDEALAAFIQRYGFVLLVDALGYICERNQDRRRQVLQDAATSLADDRFFYLGRSLLWLAFRPALTLVPKRVEW